MRGTGLKKAKTFKSNFVKKGVFGMFLNKHEHPYSNEIEEILYKHKKKLFSRCVNWREFSIFRDWKSFKDKPIHEHGETRFKGFIKEPAHYNRAMQQVNDSILSYYLFTQLQEEQKDGLADIYQASHMVNITEKFSKDYTNYKEGEWIRKTEFILWMNNYLETSVSKEFLELNSFDIALKLGQVWNGLPYKEQLKWRLLAAEDERSTDPATIKKHKTKKEFD